MTITEKINFWLNEVSHRYEDLKEKTRNMERRKEALVSGEVEAFQKELTQTMLDIAQRKSVLLG